MQWHGAEGKRLLKASPSGFLSRRIPFLPIGEIGYSTLGRGGAENGLPSQCSVGG